LIVLESAELRRYVAALPTVLVAVALLVLRPWNRQSQAKKVPLRSKVFLVLEGIPPHAWDVEVVEDLLGKTCVVEEVAPETRWADLSLFKLSAWTSELDAIPVARTLAVPEPLREDDRQLPPARELPEAEVAHAAAPPAEIKTLQYRVLIHVVAVEETAPVETALRPGAQGGDGAASHADGSQEGPDDGGGEASRHRRRMLHGRVGSRTAVVGLEDSPPRGGAGQVAACQWWLDLRGAYLPWSHMCPGRFKRRSWMSQILRRSVG
jgi:hypothetical protein